MGNRDPHHAPHNVYPCDGHDQWVAIAVTSDEEWLALCEAVGRHEWATDPRFKTAPDRKANEDALDDLIAGWTRNLEPWEAAKKLQAAGVSAGPVLSVFDMLADPHLAAGASSSTCRTPTSAPGPSPACPRASARYRRSHTGTPPSLGEHNSLVFKEMLALPTKHTSAW